MQFLCALRCQIHFHKPSLLSVVFHLSLASRDASDKLFTELSLYRFCSCSTSSHFLPLIAFVVEKSVHYLQYNLTTIQFRFYLFNKYKELLALCCSSVKNFLQKENLFKTISQLIKRRKEPKTQQPIVEKFKRVVKISQECSYVMIHSKYKQYNIIKTFHAMYK